MEEIKKNIEEFITAIKGDAHKKWLVHADHLLKIYFRRSEIPYTAEDVVGEVITKTVDEGGRNWDFNKVPLNVYMRNSIRSEVSNIYDRALKYENVDFNNQEYTLRTTEIYNQYSMSLNEIENANDFSELYDSCVEILADDTECCLVFMELREGKNRKEIAESLGLTENQILAIKQQIRRKLRKKFKLKPEGKSGGLKRADRFYYLSRRGG